MAPKINNILQTHCLIPLNKIYKSKRDYIKSLEKKVEFTLGPNWKISSKVLIGCEGAITQLEFISPEKIRISNYFELMSYCDFRHICKKKVQFISFQIWNYRSNSMSWEEYGTFIAVEIVQTAMKRALKRLKARKQILSQL